VQRLRGSTSRLRRFLCCGAGSSKAKQRVPEVDGIRAGDEEAGADKSRSLQNKIGEIVFKDSYLIAKDSYLISKDGYVMSDGMG
jgi:hypothetical protein